MNKNSLAVTDSTFSQEAWRLGEALLASAVRHAARPALCVGEEHFTYSELFEQAGRVTASLAAVGAKPSSRVAILAKRSMVAYSAILGTLLAGCTYIPLNTRFPPTRNRAILNASEAVAVVVESACIKDIDQIIDQHSDSLTLIVPDGDVTFSPSLGKILTKSELPVATLGTIPRGVKLQTEDPAYILFTSGTTGAPKGVPISHGNLASYISGVHLIAPLAPEDRVLQLVDLTFDLSVHDMFVTWLAGAELYAVPEHASIFVSRFIRQHSITSCMLVPSTAAQARDRGLLVPNSMESLRNTLFLGEALPVEVARSWARAAPYSRVLNTYGPTECTVLVSSFEFTPDAACDKAVVPIGKPLQGTKMTIFDAEHREVPNGEVGELHLGGPQLTKGYWRAPELDSVCFVRVQGERWYRTGDVAYYDDKLGFVFNGRLDRQVKVNGYRVELQEAEGALRRVCGREQVAIIPWPLVSPGNAEGLVAFVAGIEINGADILDEVARLLPPYMVPSRIIFLENLPLNSNGKVDYKVLAADYRIEKEAGNGEYTP